jgi:putative lipoic acid-binding regulatory protein
MLTFPVKYTFDITGKNSGDESARVDYIEQIKTIVFCTARDYAIKCQIIPTGKKFTKLQLECEVASVDMINTIYDDL